MRPSFVAFLALIALPATFAAGAYAREARLPVPPIPPAHPPGGEAPVPNLEIQGPPLQTRQSTFTLDTEINHRATPSTGAAFSPGSHYQLDNDRRLSWPGLMLHLPFP
jgi:hypothetical protein